MVQNVIHPNVETTWLLKKYLYGLSSSCLACPFTGVLYCDAVTLATHKKPQGRIVIYWKGTRSNEASHAFCKKMVIARGRGALSGAIWPL